MHCNLLSTFYWPHSLLSLIQKSWTKTSSPSSPSRYWQLFAYYTVCHLMQWSQFSSTDIATDFSRNSGLLLNLVLSVYKIVLLSVFIIVACVYSNGPDNGRAEWDDPRIVNRQPIAALVYIIYSYQGWENSNYVSTRHSIEMDQS